MRLKLIYAFLFICIVKSITASAYAEEPSVELFSPQGIVKGVRQVSVRFTDQMVTFGDFRSNGLM